MLVSVCIPTYSRLEYLKKAVQSVLDQTYVNFEVCISQDPKIDGPDISIQNWCVEQQRLNSHIRYQLNPVNLGLAGNWNQLVAMAKGRYLIIIGDDDKLEPYYLEKFVSKINENLVDVCFCDQYFIDGHDNINAELTETNSKLYCRASQNEGLISETIDKVLKNSVPMSAALIKKDWLIKYPFDAALNTPEIEIFLKIAMDGGTFYYIKERLAYFRVHTLSATSAGLNVHYLVTKLIAINLPVKYENAKYELISRQITVAVNRYLKANDKENAKILLNSIYYPKKPLYRVVQTFLAHSPYFFTKIVLGK